jgi:mono/diheme cytochrome c family protein
MRIKMRLRKHRHGKNGFGLCRVQPQESYDQTETEDAMRYIVLMLCSIAATGALTTALAAADAAAGKEIYSKKCTSCHGISGEAKESAVKALKVEMRHLGSKEVQAKSDAELKKIILEGSGKMKSVSIDAKAADDVVAYLRTLKK